MSVLLPALLFLFVVLLLLRTPHPPFLLRLLLSQVREHLDGYCKQFRNCVVSVGVNLGKYIELLMDGISEAAQKELMGDMPGEEWFTSTVLDPSQALMNLKNVKGVVIAKDRQILDAISKWANGPLALLRAGMSEMNVDVGLLEELAGIITFTRPLLLGEHCQEMKLPIVAFQRAFEVSRKVMSLHERNFLGSKMTDIVEALERDSPYWEATPG